MTEFNFSKARIDEHIQKIGVDVRPAFEPKLDFVKLNHVGSVLRDKYPNLFESLVQSPSEFRIMKKFIISGRPEVEAATLLTTPRGMVFSFPKLIAAVGEEIEFENIADTVVACIKEIRKTFSQKKIIRVGIVNEYIFSTDVINSAKILCDRFLKLKSPAGDEILLRVNLRTDDFNRVIEMKPVHKVQKLPEIGDRPQNAGYGLKVKVDFNNIDMSKVLEENDMFRIIREGEKFCDNDLYMFLNRE